jgi:UrcA family protein
MDSQLETAIRNQTTNQITWRNKMNTITKTLTITVSALLLTAGQTALADSLGEPTTGAIKEAFEGPAIRLVATPNSDTVITTVSYTRQDLESEVGVQRVYQLLQSASKGACGGENTRNGRNVIMKSSQVRCYQQSLSKAVSEIDNENLTRIHAG